MLLAVPDARIAIARVTALAALAVLGLTAGSNSLRADTVYTTFGANYTYSTEAGLLVANDDVAEASLAVEFTPTANYDLTSIEFAATEIDPLDAGATIGIFADNGGQPGAAIETYAVNALGQFGSLAPVITVESVLQPLLLADTNYWIAMNAPAGDFLVWNQTVTSATGVSQTDGLGNWSSSPGTPQVAAEVDGSLASFSPPDFTPEFGQGSEPSTPEPATWWLMGGGFVAIALWVRYRTGASRQSRPVTPTPLS